MISCSYLPRINIVVPSFRERQSLLPRVLNFMSCEHTQSHSYSSFSKWNQAQGSSVWMRSKWTCNSVVFSSLRKQRCFKDTFVPWFRVFWNNGHSEAAISPRITGWEEEKVDAYCQPKGNLPSKGDFTQLWQIIRPYYYKDWSLDKDVIEWAGLWFDLDCLDMDVLSHLCMLLLHFCYLRTDMKGIAGYLCPFHQYGHFEYMPFLWISWWAWIYIYIFSTDSNIRFGRFMSLNGYSGFKRERYHNLKHSM